MSTLKNRFLFLVCLIISGNISAVYAVKDSIPKWLDTIPPVISIDPHTKYHSTIFHVTLQANEHSQIWYALQNREKMNLYKGPVSLTDDGKYTIYYFGEDDFTNKSKIDSAVFVIDKIPPIIAITPKSGVYLSGTTIRIKCNEAATVKLVKNKRDSSGILISGDSLNLSKTIDGYIVAVDSAGNKSVSERLSYSIDTSSIRISLAPQSEMFNTPQKIELKSSTQNEIYYTFDPVAPKQLFSKYSNSVIMPFGLSMLRYFGRNQFGRESEIFTHKYIVDTTAPKITSQIRKGKNNDTLILSTDDQSIIHYELGRRLPSKESNVYTIPLIIPHKSRFLIWAQAVDEVGNFSEVFQYDCKYDNIAPIIKISNNGGSFTSIQKVFFESNEPAKIFYTLDGSQVSDKSLLYTSDGITISRQDSTILRYIGVDDAGNYTNERQVAFFLDTRAPIVKARISGSIQDDKYSVTLSANEPATIYYEIGSATPTTSSPVYTVPIILNSNQTMNYFAVDKLGNCSQIYPMDELKRPRVEASPDGGIYNKKLKIVFMTNQTGPVQWRLLPDTVFKPFTDTIRLNQEGIYTLEYFLQGVNDKQSPIHRKEYTIDWTSPHVNVNLSKGLNDTINVLFEASENATIYYTTDGSNPQYSSSTRTAANKFLQFRDRIKIPRKKDSRLAFYAEDVAKNQSAITVMDVFSPRAIPNVPSGTDKIYDRILSITLNTIDQSTIYYCQHAHKPTIDSTIYKEPITLVKSDTILAFVVDVSGFKGPIDTFVYQIDLPPSPQLIIKTDSIIRGKEIRFDASGSIDKETPFNQLLFRWDFDGDGKFDTDSSHNPIATHIFSKPGIYNVRLEVIDANNRKSQISQKVVVNDKCPSDMISINYGNGKHFCIDVYEWPNLKNKYPQTKVSWVEAKMSCIDAGKRLCNAEEWEAACHDPMQTVYSYGDKYEMKKCPTEGKSAYKSGSFSKCSKSNVQDMIGNVWEWVEDKDGDYPFMYGGTYKYGKDAHCGLRAEGSVASRSEEIGFRCCK